MEKANIIKVAFDTTLEGVILTNSDAKIVMANKAIEKCLGYKIEELMGKDISIFVPNFLQKIHKAHYKTYFKNPDYSSLHNAREITGVHKNGKIIPLEVRLNLFDYEGEKYAKALITDITERKEKEKKLINAKMKLEEEIKDNTIELEKVVKKLLQSNNNLEIEIQKKIKAKKRAKKALIVERELSQLKTKFISLASHEFRTPLSGIQTSATLINKYSKNNKNIRKHVDVINSLVKYLSTILDDFLSLERVETNDIHYNFTSFQFNKLMHEVIHEAKSFTKNGQIINYTPCNECPNMYQDRKIIYIIISNILFNALKYSYENSQIDISVIVNKDITISIADQGIGIPQEDQKFLFKRFYRASNATHIQGTGIGLNIVKANIESLGGSIFFKSKKNKGTTFTIKLPKDISIVNNIKE